MIIISHKISNEMCFNLKVLTVIAVSAVFGIGRANGGSYIHTDVEYLIPKQYCKFLRNHRSDLGANESWESRPAAPKGTKLLPGTDMIRDRCGYLCDECLGVIFDTLMRVKDELIKEELEKSQSSLVTLSKNLNADNTLPENEKTISLSSLVTLFQNLSADNTLPKNKKTIQEQFLKESNAIKGADRCKFSLAAEKIGKDTALWESFLKEMVPVTRGFLLCDAFRKKYGVEMTDFHAKFLDPKRYLDDTTVEILKDFYEGYKKTIHRCRLVRKFIEYSFFPIRLKSYSDELKRPLWEFAEENFGIVTSGELIDVAADFRLYESLPYGMPKYLQPAFSFSEETPYRTLTFSTVGALFCSDARKMRKDVVEEFTYWLQYTCNYYFYLKPEKVFRAEKFSNSVTECNRAFQVLFKKLVKNYAGDTEQLITFLESIDEKHKEHRDCLSVICYVCSRIEALKKKIKVQEKAGNLEKDKIEVQKGK